MQNENRIEHKIKSLLVLYILFMFPKRAANK